MSDGVEFMKDLDIIEGRAQADHERERHQDVQPQGLRPEHPASLSAWGARDGLS